MLGIAPEVVQPAAAPPRVRDLRVRVEHVQNAVFEFAEPVGRGEALDDHVVVRPRPVQGPLIGYFFEPEVRVRHALLNATHPNIVAERRGSRRGGYQKCATSTTTREPAPGPSRVKTRIGSRARTPSPTVVWPSNEPAQDT